MKKGLIYILLTMMGIMALTFVAPVYAADDAAKKDVFKAPVMVRPSLLPGPDKEQVQTKGSRKILTESVLPKFAINLISFIGAVALLFVVIGGVRYTMVYNNEEAGESAKNQVLYAIVGFLIALLAYTIVTIVTNIKFSNESAIHFFPSAYASAIDVDLELLPTPGVEYDGAEDDGTKTEFYSELSAVENLPQVDESIVITTVIKTILGAASLLTIIAIVVAGIYFLVARGEEEKATKAKGILTSLIIGMVIIAAAYAVISGVAQFDFLGK